MRKKVSKVFTFDTFFISFYLWSSNTSVCIELLELKIKKWTGYGDTINDKGRHIQ